MSLSPFISDDKLEEAGIEVRVPFAAFLPSPMLGLPELELLRFKSCKPSAPLYLNVVGSLLFAKLPTLLTLVCLLDPE